jgi:hypothetical protein
LRAPTIKRTPLKHADCASCGKDFVHKATRPKRFCGRPCQKAASNVLTNARRAPTGNRPGRLSLGSQKTLKADRAVLAPLNSDVASTASQARLEQASVAREEIASRHNIGDRVRIWVDDPSIGCGERHLIVTAIGRVHVKLYSYANLAEVTVSRRYFEAHAQAYRSHAPTVLRILECNLAVYRKNNLEHDRPCERAVEALRKEATT